MTRADTHRDTPCGPEGRAGAAGAYEHAAPDSFDGVRHGAPAGAGTTGKGARAAAGQTTPGGGAAARVAQSQSAGHDVQAQAAVSGAEPEAALKVQGLPEWLAPVRDAARTIRPEQLSRFLPPEGGGGRQSAVLVLFGHGERGPELLLMERSASLRSHAGQPAFPGGSLDPEDGDPATVGPLRCALREAQEETGLDPSGVQLFSVLPRLYIPVSGFVVTPVLGWWHTPSPVDAVDLGETARVFAVPVADLADPVNRAMAVHPRGHQGPAFLVASTLVWGFTAGVIDRILHYAGWERPWDRDRLVSLDRWS